MAIEQGRLTLAQHTMKVDTKPFPQVNVVELSDFGFEGQDLAFQINMVGPMRRRDKQRREAASGKRPQDEHESEQQHVTEEQVRHIRNQLPASNRLLEKYQYQYKVRRRYESKRRSMSTAQGGHWGGARLYATTGIARSSGTVGTSA